MFVSEIIDQVIEVLGRCDRKKALRRISDAVQALQDEGDWMANIGALDIVTSGDGSVVTLPRDVETPLAVAISGMPVFMRDEFYRFHLNGDGLTDEHVVPWVWDDSGTVPNFMDIETPGPLIARCDSETDVGVPVRVLGTDANGRELRQQLENGDWIDGVETYATAVPGIPAAAPTSVPFLRVFETAPTGILVSSTAHGLSTAAQMQVQLVSGAIPQPLINGGFYFIRVVDATKVLLYATRLDAQTSQRAIEFSSIDVNASVSLREARPAAVRTAFQTSSANLISSGDLITFSGNPLPAPIDSTATYVASPLTVDKFIVYVDENDLENEANPVNVTTPGTNVEARILKRMFPLTQLSFSFDHNFETGDQVTVSNSGGELPQPLVANTPYFVRALSSTTVSLHSTSADAATGANPISLTSLGVGTNSLVKRIAATVAGGGSSVVTTSSPHNLSAPSGTGATARVSNGVVRSITVATAGSGYTSDPSVSITGGGGTGATAIAVRSGNTVASVTITNAGSGYTSTPTVTISGGAGNGATANAAIGPQAGSISSIAVTAGGSDYKVSPKVEITGGGGTGATAEAIVSGGAVQSIRMITQGTGYTSLPTVTIAAQGGSFVRFTTNGTLPAPLSAETVYRGEAPLTSTTFSLNDTIPLPVAIASGGAGQLYVVISRSFTVGFLPQWSVDATALSTGDSVRFYTNGILPGTAPSQVDQSTLYYARKISNSLIELYDSAVNANAAPPTVTGRFSAVTVGTDLLYLSRARSVAVSPRDNSLDIDFTAFLENLTTVRFTTDGVLPAPLATGTDYRVNIVGDRIEVYTTGNVLIPLTTVGSGTHEMVINRVMSVPEATSIDVTDHGFLTGTPVTVASSLELPSPLVADTPYYVRAIDDDAVELYLTQSESENIGFTDGRISFATVGTGTHRVILLRTPTEVKLVTAIEKPLTEGYVRLYAWDTAKSNNVALLGDFHPTETNPLYRRIRINKSAKSVRLKYRRRPIDILTDRDFINLDSRMAILSMVQSQELLFKKFVAEAEQYRLIAVEYLNKRNRALDGPRAPTIQINADVTTRPDDWME